MNIDIFGSALLGLATALLLYFWKRGSSKWAHWLPVIRKTAEWTLKVAIAGVVVLELYIVFGRSDNPGVSLLSGVLGYAAFEGYKRYSGNRLFRRKEQFNRGTRIASAEEVKKLVFQKLPKKSQPPRLDVGMVPIPRVAEPYHFGIMGSTGTGKSVQLNQFLQEVRKENDTVIVVDSGGAFIEKHYDPECDFIFNPFDNRCINWSPLFEMKGPWDASALAKSIVPDGVGDNKDWNGYAQTFLTSLMTKLNEEGRLDLKDLLYYALAASYEELLEYLKGTAAVGQMGSDRTFGSIRNILTSHLSVYANLPGGSDYQFSVRDMVDQEHSGFLFMSYRDDQLDSVKELFACMLDVIARAILSQNEDPTKQRRIWLVIDEFASLGRVQSIESVATKARKMGGCLVLGIQTISQLKGRYGEHGAQTILSCLSTWLVLRTEDADTAEYLSRYIGEVEVTRVANSVNQADSGNTQGQNEQQTTVKAVLPSEIQSLPSLEGFLRLSGGYPICKVQLDYNRVNPSNPANLPFVLRDIEQRPMMKFGTPAGAAAAPANNQAAPALATQQPGSPATAPAKRELIAPTRSMSMPMERPEEEPLLGTHVLIRRPVKD